MQGPGTRLPRGYDRLADEFRGFFGGFDESPSFTLQPFIVEGQLSTPVMLVKVVNRT